MRRLEPAIYPHLNPHLLTKFEMCRLSKLIQASFWDDSSSVGWDQPIGNHIWSRYLHSL